MALDVAIETRKPLVIGYHNVLLHRRCACHFINLIVMSGLDIVHDAIRILDKGIFYLNATRSDWFHGKILQEYALQNFWIRCLDSLELNLADAAESHTLRSHFHNWASLRAWWTILDGQ